MTPTCAEPEELFIIVAYMLVMAVPLTLAFPWVARWMSAYFEWVERRGRR